MGCCVVTTDLIGGDAARLIGNDLCIKPLGNNCTVGSECSVTGIDRHPLHGETREGSIAIGNHHLELTAIGIARSCGEVRDRDLSARRSQCDLAGTGGGNVLAEGCGTREVRYSTTTKSKRIVLSSIGLEAKCKRAITQGLRFFSNREGADAGCIGKGAYGDGVFTDGTGKSTQSCGAIDCARIGANGGGTLARGVSTYTKGRGFITNGLCILAKTGGAISACSAIEVGSNDVDLRWDFSDGSNNFSFRINREVLRSAGLIRASFTRLVGESWEKVIRGSITFLAERD